MSTRKGASRNRGASARSGSKKVKFRSIELVLPAKADGQAVFFIQEDNITGALRCLIGEKNWLAVTEKCSKDKLDFTATTDALGGLFEDVVDTYGLIPGE